MSRLRAVAFRNFLSPVASEKEAQTALEGREEGEQRQLEETRKELVPSLHVPPAHRPADLSLCLTPDHVLWGMPAAMSEDTRAACGRSTWGGTEASCPQLGEAPPWKWLLQPQSSSQLRHSLC